MPSAFKDGQLKKNPLLGSTLGSDPGRAAEKERFMGLYGEAKQVAGEGRAGMMGRLASRHARLGESEQRALGGLRSQYSGLQEKARSVRDPEKEKELQKNITEAERNKASSWEKPQRKEAMNMLKEEGQWEGGPKKQRKAQVEAFWGGKIPPAVKAQELYEMDVAAQVKRLQTEGKPLAAEFDRRSHALQQRINDYNLFLGTY